MPDDPALRIFPDEYVPNAEGADYHKRWVKANPLEASKWAAFRDAVIATGNGAIPVMATKYGRALVAAGKEHMSISRLVGAVTAPYPPPDPPPSGNPTGNPYFVSDWSAGTFGSPWTTLFYNGSPGFVDLSQTGPVTQTPDGRAQVVDDPAGSALKVARFEIRDSDPAWAVLPDRHKCEVRTIGQPTLNKPTVDVGDVRWFSAQIYCPWTATEKFEVGQGSDDWNEYLEIHSTANTSSALQVAPYGVATSQRMYFRCYGGVYPDYATYAEEITLWQVTDSGGAPVMANHNRWITVMWGMRFAPDTTGWLEVWVDGVNIYPRKNRPTMWTLDVGTGVYLKHGLHNSLAGANYPVTGRTVIYYGRVLVGMTKADVI